MQAMADSEFNPDRYAFIRANAVSRCVRFRYLIAHPKKIAKGAGSVSTVRLALRKDQMLMLKMRIWRSTGRYPQDN